MAKILATRQLTPVTKLFVVDAPLIARAARPGQFVMLRVREGGERIPVTIADYDREAGSVTIVVQAVGATTRRVDALGAGDEILDIVGPLGTAVEIPPGGHVVGVGGGFGTAALLCLMRELTARGDRTTALLGARTQDLLILVDELRKVSTNVEICTDDGSVGYHGMVTGRLAELIAGQGPGRPDRIVAIGPVVMMRAVAEAARSERIPTYASMDPLMIDGTGMCGGCRVIVGGKSMFACVDGPFFDAHQVDFEVAMRRAKTYVREEHVAAERLAAAAGGR
jgi:ferredoxin/flavodoxin---NADP+ reductase